MTDDNTVDLLLAARDVYAEQGGGVGVAAMYEAPYCVLGALRQVEPVDREMYAVTDTVVALAAAAGYKGPPRDALRTPMAVWSVNDHTPDAVRKQRVLDLYDDAIRYAKDHDSADPS